MSVLLQLFSIFLPYIPYEPLFYNVSCYIQSSYIKVKTFNDKNLVHLEYGVIIFITGRKPNANFIG